MTIALPEAPARPALPAARPATIADKLQYCQALAQSGMLPRQYKGQPANLLYAVEYAGSLGLHPMVAITGVHVIEGKPAASSALISALVRRAGHKLRVRGDATQAVAQIIRADDRDWTFEVTFTMDDARQAGLTGKDVWKRYPASMLKARAITAVARDACEEALFGLHYTPEELGAVVDQEGRPVYIAGEPVMDRPTAPAVPVPEPEPERDWLAEAQAAAAEGVEALREVWRKARTAGAPQDVQDAITELARHRPADPAPEPAPAEAAPPVPEPVPTAPPAGVPATTVPSPLRNPRAAYEARVLAAAAEVRATALADMFAAGTTAGLTAAETREAFVARHGVQPEGALPAQLDAMTADLREAAGSEHAA